MTKNDNDVIEGKLSNDEQSMISLLKEKIIQKNVEIKRSKYSLSDGMKEIVRYYKKASATYKKLVMDERKF